MDKEDDVLIEIEKKEGIITNAIYSSSYWEQTVKAESCFYRWNNNKLEKTQQPTLSRNLAMQDRKEFGWEKESTERKLTETK